MKWGYNDGNRNGKRTASDILKDKLGVDEYQRMKEAKTEQFQSAMRFEVAKGNKNDSINVVKRYQEYREAGRKYEKAQAEFYKTPMGALPGLANKIVSGANYIAEKLNKKKKSNLKVTHDASTALRTTSKHYVK